MKLRLSTFILIALAASCFLVKQQAGANDTEQQKRSPASKLLDTFKSADDNHPAKGPQDTPLPAESQLKLFGRIEQLEAQQGAALPRRLQKLTPMLDLGKIAESADGKPFSGAELKSFPVEWEGTWRGNVTVVNRENLELSWLAQPAACYRSCQFFKLGSQLNLVCRFYKEDGKLTLSPPIATGRFKHAEDLVQAIIAGQNLSVKVGPGQRIRLGPDDLNQKTTPLPKLESFSFGKRYGPSIGGNFVNNDVITNQLRELAPGVVEQDVVTSGTTQSLYGVPESVSSLGESVVRLTKKDNKLLVVLAYVNYQPDGLCVNKCILSGTLERVGN